MRVEKGNPEQRYGDLGDWLQTGWNAIWLFSLAGAYLYYLMTTEEI